MGSYLRKVLKQDDDDMCTEEEMLYTQLWSELHSEINGLKRTLIELDRDDRKSQDILTDHTRKISDTLQTISDNKLDTRRKITDPNHSKNALFECFPNPIHALLSIGQLRRAQIPSEVVENLISAGFDINDYDDDEDETCLYRAIKYNHYNVVRLLIKHETECCDTNGEERPPIILLASYSNVPLDLFDLLATPCNLEAALCNAAANGCIKPALHLIKLGARVDGLNSYGRLPVDYFVGHYTSDDLQQVGDDPKQGNDEVKLVSDDFKQVSDDINQDCDDIKQVSDDIKQDGDDIKQVSDDIKQDGDDIKQVTDDIEQVSDDIEQVSDDIEQVSDNIEQVSDDIKQDVHDIKHVSDDPKQIFNLFMSLLPSRPQGVDILRVICTLLKRTYMKTINNMNEMLHQLVQRLDIVQPLNLTIKVDSYDCIIHLNANGVVILKGTLQHTSCQTVYLCCLILSELQLDVITPPDISPLLRQMSLLTETMAYAHATDDLLKDFHQQHNVKSLLRHCILRIRTSMRSLDSNSFLNLPVPTYIRRLLTLQDISEKIYKVWCNEETKP